MMAEAISIKEYFERVFSERDDRYSQRFDAQEKAVAAALAAAKEAVTKAETATEKRLEGVNEFRQSLEDQQRTFIRQDVFDARFKGLEDQLALLATQASENKGRGVGRNDAWAYLVAGVSLAIAIAALFLKS